MSVNWGKELQTHFKKRRAELHRLLDELVSLNTENPPGQEQRACAWLAQFAREQGIHAVVSQYSPPRSHADPGRSNIQLEVGRGPIRLTLAVPLDTRMLTGPWEADPLQLRLDGRRDVDGAVVGNVAGSYVHGLFDSGTVAARLAEKFLSAKGLPFSENQRVDQAQHQERQYDLLASALRGTLSLGDIYRLLELPYPVSNRYWKRW